MSSHSLSSPESRQTAGILDSSTISRASSEHTRRDSLVVGDGEPVDVEKAKSANPVGSELTKGEESWEVFLDATEDPKKRRTSHKWLIVFVLSTSATCVTCASSVVSGKFIPGLRRAPEHMT